MKNELCIHCAFFTERTSKSDDSLYVREHGPLCIDCYNMLSIREAVISDCASVVIHCWESYSDSMLPRNSRELVVGVLGEVLPKSISLCE